MVRDPATERGKMPPINPDYDPNDPEYKDWDGISSIADIFFGKPVYTYSTFIPNLDIAPAYASQLLLAERVTQEEVITKIHERLNHFLSQEEVKNEYKFVVIDTPPSKGPLTISAFKAATHVIIPTQMEGFSVDGIYGMLQLWKQETYCRSPENPIELVGLLVNKFRKVSTQMQYYEMLKNSKNIKDYLIPHKIHLRTVYNEVLEPGAQPKIMSELSKNHPARLETEKFCKFVYKKVFNNG